MSLPPISGQDALKALYRKGYEAIRIRGSHAVVGKEGERPFTVPLHRELKKGTLNHIIKCSKDFKDDFFKHLY